MPAAALSGNRDPFSGFPRNAGDGDLPPSLSRSATQGGGELGSEVGVSANDHSRFADSPKAQHLSNELAVRFRLMSYRSGQLFCRDWGDDGTIRNHC